LEILRHNYTARSYSVTVQLPHRHTIPHTVARHWSLANVSLIIVSSAVSRDARSWRHHSACIDDVVVMVRRYATDIRLIPDQLLVPTKSIACRRVNAS